jgi:hypothetical protein
MIRLGFMTMEFINEGKNLAAVAKEQAEKEEVTCV